MKVPTPNEIKNMVSKAERNLLWNMAMWHRQPTQSEKLLWSLNQNLEDGTIVIENPPAPEDINAEIVKNIMMIYRPVTVIEEPK